MCNPPFPVFACQDGGLHPPYLLEEALGLAEGRLQNGFILTRVDDIQSRSPRLSAEGSDIFRGSGEGLAGGGPEVVVNPNSRDDPNTVNEIEYRR